MLTAPMQRVAADNHQQFCGSFSSSQFARSCYTRPLHSNSFKQPSSRVSRVQHDVASPNNLTYKGHEDRKKKQCNPPYKELTACAKTWWDEINMILPWDFNENSMRFQWDFNEISMIFPWGVHEISKRFSWDLHEVSIRFPLGFHEVSIRFL